jgi:hypothetical protein
MRNVFMAAILICAFNPTLFAAAETCIDFDPNTLNINGCGTMWVTVRIEVSGYDPIDINPETILMKVMDDNETLAPVLDPFVSDNESYLMDKTCTVGVPERMVKFSRPAVSQLLPLGEAVEVIITGQTYDGIPFEGTDTIRVFDRTMCCSDFNGDGKVSLSDLMIMKGEFGRRNCAQTACRADYNGDGKVDLTDLMRMKREFGRYNCPKPE